jgi:hypothetical protein
MNDSLWRYLLFALLLVWSATVLALSLMDADGVFWLTPLWLVINWLAERVRGRILKAAIAAQAAELRARYAPGWLRREV